MASVAAQADATEEIDFGPALATAGAEQAPQEILTVKCRSCGAECIFRSNVTADRCAFCATPLVAQAQSKKAIRPRAVLPFKITQTRAGARFREWVSSLWFAPNGLAREAGAGRIDGVYLPFWTFDCATSSSYSGRRGDDYQQTVKDSNGNTTTVTKTKWRAVSGALDKSFDDVLVLASSSLPTAYVEALEPWPLKELVAYDESYLSGFRAESYSLDLRGGFKAGRRIMANQISAAIKRAIGGDHQVIDELHTSYSAITFKHVLLPVWISSYRYRARVFRFLVNARTGEVQGERPWSWIKILLALLATGLLLVTMWSLFN